ncbi:hypothetical protein [Streptomyces sp. NPDC055287]
MRAALSAVTVERGAVTVERCADAGEPATPARKGEGLSGGSSRGTTETVPVAAEKLFGAPRDDPSIPTSDSN